MGGDPKLGTPLQAIFTARLRSALDARNVAANAEGRATALASRLGRSLSTTTRWLNGDMMPSLETLSEIAPADATRIADLYHQLYVGKYSPLNPVFTPAFVAMTHAAGMIRYRVARASDGAIMAVAGLFPRGDVATPPVVGYDMSRPRAEGLYRIASYLFGEDALARGVRLNGSAGRPRPASAARASMIAPVPPTKVVTSRQQCSSRLV